MINLNSMDESAEKKEPDMVIVNGTHQPERRSVSRRLVQSTLFPHKSPEIEPKVDQKAKESEDDNNIAKMKSSAVVNGRREENGKGK